jgi:cytoskeletal protein CcmA (bactofilin family)
VLGDVEVDLADLRGLVSVRGSLKAQSVTAHGTLDIGGPVDVSDTLSTEGETTLRASVRAGHVESRGALTIAADLTASRSIRSHGAVRVGGNVTTPRLDFDGRLEVTGGIVVTELSGRITGTSRATTIQAERVVVRRGGLAGRRATLEVLTIETKEAVLEGVVAEYVRADRIVVGPGCQIARIDGAVTGVHPSSHVGPVSRSPAPYGLTR